MVERDEMNAAFLAQHAGPPRRRDAIRGKPHGDAGKTRQEVVLGIEGDDLAGLQHGDPPHSALGFLR